MSDLLILVEPLKQKILRPGGLSNEHTRRLYLSKGDIASFCTVTKTNFSFSEFNVQFELPDSGIWSFDNDVTAARHGNSVC